eukprot:6186892-Pleurochrysis_carterae.AAC.1
MSVAACRRKCAFWRDRARACLRVCHFDHRKCARLLRCSGLPWHMRACKQACAAVRACLAALERLLVAPATGVYRALTSWSGPGSESETERLESVAATRAAVERKHELRVVFRAQAPMGAVVGAPAWHVSPPAHSRLAQQISKVVVARRHVWVLSSTQVTPNAERVNM